MRLIDADALREEWDTYAVDQYHLPSEYRDHEVDVMRHTEDLIDAAPTVCCEECGHCGHDEIYPVWRECKNKPSIDLYDEDGDSLPLPSAFGCPNFKAKS